MVTSLQTSLTASKGERPPRRSYCDILSLFLLCFEEAWQLWKLPRADTDAYRT